MPNEFEKILAQLDLLSSQGEAPATLPVDAGSRTGGSEAPLRRLAHLRPSAGKVGIALSGGGPQSQAAAVGQRRALRLLTTPDGESLLGLARTIVTVPFGSLESTGIADLLGDPGTTKIFALLNTPTPLAAGAHGVIGAGEEEIPGTRIVVDGQLPPLFGYRPYDPERGYLPYGAAPDPTGARRHLHQVFPADFLADVLQGLWAAAGNSAALATQGAAGPRPQAGANLHPPLYQATVPVLDNASLGVRGGREVEVLWSYCNRVREWYDQLRPEVRQRLGAFDDPSSCGGFPHFEAVRTGLSELQGSLLASLAAWCITHPAYRERYVGLFQG